MNLIYGFDKYFIGAVKFFDAKKDFGYIASNNCNMPTSKYNQDFYVSSESFLEDDAKKEGRIVVYQVDKQDNGKKRAVNVRCITRSYEDVRLALSYYGDHEYFEFTDDRQIYLYAHIFTPIEMVADKVKHIIEEDAKRSPKRTAEHFKFFVNHYKKEDSWTDRYIFDRQFSTEEKYIWISLLSIFTDAERLETLKLFPSIVKYFNDASLIHHWLEDKLSNDCSLPELQEIVNTYSFIPQECVDYSISRMEQIVDTPIKELLQKLSARSDISQEELDGVDKKDYWSEIYDREKNMLLAVLQAYFSLTSKQYGEEKAHCLYNVKINRFKEEFSAFVGKRYGDYGRNDFFKYLNNLPTEDFHVIKHELISSISLLFDKAIEEKDYSQIVGDIGQLSVMGEDFLTPYKQRLLPLVKEQLNELLNTHLNSLLEIRSVFFSAYERYTSIYGNKEKEEIRHELIPILKGTQSIWVLSEVSTESYKWLSLNDALALSKQIVSRWGYAKIKEFVKHNPHLFDHSIQFADLIIARASEVIGPLSLTCFFDGTPLEEGEKKYYSRYPEKENCAFLNDLKQLIPDGQCSLEWENYINSRSANDLLILFEHNVITSLPENIVEIIINAISLDGVYANKERWYSKPSLKNRTHVKVLETTKVNLFPLIAHRLQTMEMTDDNVALAVLLTELMLANRPNSNSDYYTRQNWETSFTSQMQKFKRGNNIDQRLAVIWWAVHSKTTISSASLSEVFALLPPYLQIKIVKKLFKFISEGKVQHNAETLYNLVSNGEKSICFPLEIAFTYLKLREKDQSKTLNNNIMHKLLEGREDTDEWIGIRSIVTQCSGRWIANELPNDRSDRKRNSYFNGIISKEQDGRLRVFISQKMVDKNGNTKDCDNIHYASAIQQIQITYKENEYQVVNEQDGVAYYFDMAYKVELFALARPFNFKYNSLSNFIGFKTTGDDQEEFCECRLSDKVDIHHGIAFYWCGNKPCFRPPVRYRTDDEWEYYTILDFMRILGISPDYINKNGKRTKFGHYIILSSYLKSFAKFYEHLKCRECGKLMKPLDITNFTSRAVTEFSCTNDSCKQIGFKVYLNHCFNKQKCNATIDSRDSKQCPNKQYICPECGACCSTQNFRLHIDHLHMTGGYIPEKLRLFVKNDLGHWEKQEYFCYKCGIPMQKLNGHYVCPKCNTEYNHC